MMKIFFCGVWASFTGKTEDKKKADERNLIGFCYYCAV